MSQSILFIDLENENHEYCGSKASPHCDLNYVVESGWRVDRWDDNGVYAKGTVQSVRYESRAEFLASPPETWLSIPDDCMVLVAHNACYEISWFLSYARATFEAFIKRGGRVYCTMHGEYLVSNQTKKYPPLDETAPLYGGTHKVDAVKLLWEQGYKTSEIDPALLHEYLCSDHGDVENTALCYYGQVGTFTQQDRMMMVNERMDALLAFAYCEWFGMYVNMPIAKKNQAEQEAEIAVLSEKLNALLPADKPAELSFKWTSLYHKSALVYGGPIPYNYKGKYETPTYVKADAYQLNAGVERSRYPTCWQDPVDGKDYITSDTKYDSLADIVIFKSGKNKGLPKVFRANTREEKLKWYEGLYYFKGLVELDKLPEYAREKYVGKGEFVTKLALRDDSPVIGTGEDPMKGLKAQGFEWAADMLKLAQLEKDTGTYYLRTIYNEDGTVKEVKGMLQFVIPDSEDGSGIIHHRLNTCDTITGRLTSSNPNLQNLPRKGTSKVKEMFTSRFGPDGLIVEVDYTALEVVMSCVHTGDLKLLALLQAGTDMHCYRLAFKENVSYEDCYEYCHNEGHKLHPLWAAMRTEIKSPSFAAQYGASASGIAFATGCTVEFAQQFLDNEASMFPDTYAFRNVIRDYVVATSAQKGQLHREVTDTGAVRLYRTGYWQSPAGMRYNFRQHDCWRPRADGRGKEKVLDFKDTQLANYWCQGEAFFLMVVAFGMLVRHFIQHDWYDGKACLITNVHDAAYLDCKDEATCIEASLATQRIMEDARLRVHKLWPNYGIIGEVPFPAVPEAGHNMMKKYHVTKDGIQWPQEDDK